MKTIKRLVILIVFSFVLASCNTALPGHSSDFLPLNSAKLPEVQSPFTQFEELKRGEMGFDGEQVDNFLRAYGIYDRVVE